MKIVKRILAFLAALIVVLAVVGFLLPTNAHVERNIEINAPAEKIFPLIANLKENGKWSPWHARDPDMKQTFTGEDGKVGSKVAWESQNKKVGTGTQEVTALVPNERVETHLDFGAQGNADAYFQIDEAGGTCSLTWGFDSDLGNNPVGRYFGLMFDGMIGPMYEEGLANIKELAEAGD
jgi:hypothetical protein